jgi:hypothetical protein
MPQAPQNIVVPPLVFGNVPGQPPVLQPPDDEVESDVVIASSLGDDEVEGSTESDNAAEEGLNP